MTKQLKPEFEKALLRIFRILDRDNDGFLNDDEIISF
jgi:Ca2+-binding EF-hand superfamily protein